MENSNSNFHKCVQPRQKWLNDNEWQIHYELSSWWKTRSPQLKRGEGVGGSGGYRRWEIGTAMSQSPPVSNPRRTFEVKYILSAYRRKPSDVETTISGWAERQKEMNVAKFQRRTTPSPPDKTKTNVRRGRSAINRLVNFFNFFRP